MPTDPRMAAPAPPAAEGKFERPEGGLQARTGPKTVPGAVPNPLLELIDQLDRLSAELRRYVAGFEIFRAAKERCDELSDAVVSTETGFAHWNRVSELLERVTPTSLQPSTDEVWANDVAAPVRRFEKAQGATRRKVERFLTAGGAPEQLDLDAIRAEARTMRAAIHEALETSGHRADHFAEEVRKCAEKIRMIIPKESAEMGAEWQGSGGKKLQETVEAPLDDSTRYKDVTRPEAESAALGQGGN
jgi:hypothetical protein